MNFFHNLVMPFLAGFVLTLAKLIADGKLLTWEESNNIALDLVLLAVGAMAAFYIDIQQTVPDAARRVFDAGVGNAMLAAILLYIRFRRKHLKLRKPGVLSGIIQLCLGTAAIAWTIQSF